MNTCPKCGVLHSAKWLLSGVFVCKECFVGPTLSCMKEDDANFIHPPHGAVTFKMEDFFVPSKCVDGVGTLTQGEA